MNNINRNKKEISPEQCEELLDTVKARFEKNMNRHKGLEWAKVKAKLDSGASLPIFATPMSSCITMGHNHTMDPGHSVAR